MNGCSAAMHSSRNSIPLTHLQSQAAFLNAMAISNIQESRVQMIITFSNLFFNHASPGPRDGYLLIVGTKAVGVWKKVSFKVTKKGQDYVSDFTPFVWLNPDRGNRVANLVEVTGLTVGDGGYLRFPNIMQAPINSPQQLDMCQHVW